MKTYYVYIMTNKWNTVLYTGVTNNLLRRVSEHKNKKASAFTRKYKCTKLVYFVETNDIADAIAGEKRIKAGSRKKKMELIENMNPEWEDLAKEWF